MRPFETSTEPPATKTTSKTDPEEALFDLCFAFSKEFKWTPDYIICSLPVRWLRAYATRLNDMYERQEAAMKGKGTVPKRELRRDRIAEKNARLARLTGVGLDLVE